MALELRDGRVFRGQTELFTLTLQEQDELIKQLYPNDKQLMSIPEQRKKQTSWSGTTAFDVNQFAVVTEPVIDPSTCEVAEFVYKWGGTRLLTLYCHNFNFAGAAMDLGMNYYALNKWWSRFRAKALESGLTKELLFSKMSTRHRV